MARRLFKRMILMFSVLTMLVIPTGQASGQEDPLHDGELEGTVGASDVLSTCPDPTNPANHCRAEGVFTNASISIVARRPDDGTGRRHEVACTTDQGGNVIFRGRQDAAQGRGFIGPADHIVAPGTLFRDENDNGVFEEGEIANVNCRIRVDEGVFHRIGTVAFGSIRVDVHTTDNDAEDPFRHHYCVRFEASAVPTAVGGTVVTAVAQGRVDACGSDDPIHTLGRGTEDPEHG